ncbi:hypothetical protein TNCV_512101 [Trichonephila clavipes]|nr:hypothetical protein TNCV_512101 [Trichonephila clavipes]
MGIDGSYVQPIHNPCICPETLRVDKRVFSLICTALMIFLLASLSICEVDLRRFLREMCSKTSSDDLSYIGEDSAGCKRESQEL